MRLWSVFVTGLVAGGASCAAVQGGLLAGLIARRQPAVETVPAAGSQGQSGSRSRPKKRNTPKYEPANWRLDLLPVTGFLAGKLVSHTLLGVLLGLVGSTVQLSFRLRGMAQIIAGVIMIMLAADLLGFRGFRRILPRPPARFARLVRQNAKSRAVAAPAILGFATVLIPCGVTLSIAFLAMTAGNPLEGGAIMAAFVLGTSPLFAALGYAARRSATSLKGRLSKVAAVMVIGAGLISLNSGLVLAGSRVTLSSALTALRGNSSSETGSSTIPDAHIGSDGVQEILIGVQNTSYSPSRIRAQAGMPSRLILRTNGTRGCTRGFVIPSANFQKVLPETGDTPIDLGVLKAGTIHYTCSMGMYRGSIDVV